MLLSPDHDARGATHLGIRELRRDLATHVRRAGNGERVVITVDGAPVAQLGEIDAGPRPDLDALAAAGLVRRPLRNDRPGPPADLPPLPVDVTAPRVLSELRGDLPRRQ